MKTDATYLGAVQKVAGSLVTVEISPDLPSTSPIIGGRIHRIGQIGTFVRFPLGYLDVFGIVSMVGVSRLLQPEDPDLPTLSQRLLQVQLVGEILGKSDFQRGVSSYPTIDDEVHVVTEADLERIYARRSGSQVRVGSYSSSEGLSANLDLNKVVTRHCAVVGSTGSGKSNSVAALLRGLTGGEYPGTRVVVVDPHGEYGRAFPGISTVLRIADPTTPLYVPYWALGFDELAWLLVDRRSASESIQDALLRDRIFALRSDAVTSMKARAAGVTLSSSEITADAPIAFDIKEVWYHFDRAERATYTDMSRTTEALIREGSASAMQPAEFRPPGAGAAAPFKAQPPPVMGGYVNKLLAKLRDRRFDFMLKPGGFDGITLDLDDLAVDWIGRPTPITVLDLSGVPSEVIDLVVGAVARILFEVMFWGKSSPGVGRDRPLLVVFEEAHTYLPSGDARFLSGYAKRSVQRILKEGRKYGIGAVVVSQRPSELDETVLSQCGTFVALRLTNGQDQGRVAATVPDELSGLIGLLPILRTGEALVLGDAMQVPSRIRLDLVEPRPDSQDPDVAERWRAQHALPCDFGPAIVGWRRQRHVT